jgi:predicted porin
MSHRTLAAACLALAATTTAHAQSTLNLYGIVDAWVGRMENKAGPTTGDMTLVESGGLQASRWGMRGEEDLGGGLKARFILEQGIALDSGSISTVSLSAVGFNRASYVALVGRAGELRLGRMLTAYDALRGSTNQLYDSSGFASTGQVWGAGSTAANGLAAVSGSDYLARGNNTFLVRSPQFGPVMGSVSLTLGEGATTATTNPRILTGHVEYASGPLRIGYAFQREKFSSGANRFDLVGGHYNFGIARLVYTAQAQKDERIAGGQKSREFQAGLDAPFGAATVAVGYARAITKNAAGAEVVDANGISALATYALSKRTRLYAAARRLQVERADGSDALRQLRYGAGVTHQF